MSTDSDDDSNGTPNDGPDPTDDIQPQDPMDNPEPEDMGTEEGEIEWTETNGVVTHPSNATAGNATLSSSPSSRHRSSRSSKLW